MDFQVVAHVLGRLMGACCLVSLWPLAYSAFLGEGMTGIFMETIALTGSISVAMYFFGKGCRDVMNIREGIAVTGLGWIFCVVVCAAPYWMGGHLSLVDSIFEASSGLGCMGATVIPDVEILPKSLLFWRLLYQWIGGLGIIVVFIALLPQFGHGLINMMNAESVLGSGRTVPRLKEMAAELFGVYFLLTLAAAVVFYLCGMSAFDALLHAFSTIATGGFSTHNDSVAYYGSPYIEGWMVFFMVLASLNFALYVSAKKKGLKYLLGNIEVKAYVGLLGCFVLLITIDLALQMDYPLGRAFREAAFHAVSFSSSTGFAAADFDKWPAFSHICLLLLMLVGGCSGSTAGGFKLTRAIILAKGFSVIFHRLSHPNREENLALDGNSLGMERFFQAGRYLVIYLFFCALWATLLMLDGMSPWEAVGASCSAMSCIGAAFGQVSLSFAGVPDFSKLIISFAVLLGRLEIFTVLAVFSPEFWKSRDSWE